MDPEFPGNSNSKKTRAEPEAKKIEKVVTGPVRRRKKPLGKRMAETFVGGEAGSVWGYVLLDVMIPAAKDMIADAMSTGVERMLFGEVRSRGRRTSSYGSPNGYVQYGRQSSRREREEPRRQISRRGRSQHSFDDIILDSRVECEEVIDRLYAIVEKYEQATVADLYELTDIEATFADDKWGWTDIRGAGVTRVSNGYLLDLPRPEPLD